MDIIGLDLHKRESQLSIKAEDGTITDRAARFGWERGATESWSLYHEVRRAPAR